MNVSPKELELINTEDSGCSQKKHQCFYNRDNVIIPVVYTTDYNYLKYTIVSMCSILEHPTTNIIYRFIILTPKGNAEAYRELIDSSLYKYSNFTVEIYEIGEEFEGAYLNLRDLPISAYYRLILSKLLKDCDKCIYIDGDTVVLDNLFSLYSIDLADNYIGAVEAIGYYEDKEYHMNRLNIEQEDKFKYYNAGVLLMNLKQLREDNVVDKFMSMIGNEFESQDQDIINVVCADRIVSISAAYNVMTKYTEWDDNRFLNIMGESNYNEYKKQINKPVIIHYADKVKPWNDTSLTYANHWWEIALKTPCWNMFAAEKTDFLLKLACDSQKIKSFINLTESIQKIEKEKKELERALQKNINEVKKIKKENEQLKNSLADIVSSVSFKTGRIITFIPRKIRSGIKCYKENGIEYTLNHFFEKIKRKITG